MTTFAVTEKNRVKRVPQRGHYDTDTIYGILDDAMLCHIGFIQDGQPFVIPTLYARKDDQLLMHGASTSRLFQHIQAGNEISVSVAILDGIVVAKTVFNQSINYRSVVLFGKGRLIEEEDEKLKALEFFTEHLMPGVWEKARKPSPAELKATSIVSVSIDTASAKMRAGQPKDDDEDKDLPAWAGVLPIKQVIQAPMRADYTDAGIPLPESIMEYISKKNQ